MNEQQLRQNVVSIAKSYLGCKEADGSHKVIIDTYNANKPLARGYTMTYKDSWCACFVSVVALKAGLLDIMPKEVSCNQMIALYKSIGRWMENDAYIPKAGDIIFYDWQDSGSGDNTGTSEHVGIVVSVTGSTIRVIEGNLSDAVGYRDIKVNGRYIRGYGLPDYASKVVVEAPVNAKAVSTVKFGLPNGKLVDIEGFIEEGRTYVQARGLLESLGFKVEWDGNASTVLVR